jgi:hypothetical protein
MCVNWRYWGAEVKKNKKKKIKDFWPQLAALMYNIFTIKKKMKSTVLVELVQKAKKK